MTEQERAYAPHCDQMILHAPSACQYCDDYPDWQEHRSVARINYSGEHDPDKAPCPSERYRTEEIRDRWPGNRAYPAGTEPGIYYPRYEEIPLVDNDVQVGHPGGTHSALRRLWHRLTRAD